LTPTLVTVWSLAASNVSEGSTIVPAASSSAGADGLYIAGVNVNVATPMDAF
jgi:hypothetical protein